MRPAFCFCEAVIESVGQLKLHPRIGTSFRGSIAGLRSWRMKDFRPSCVSSEFSTANVTLEEF
jgi:hypothetical protein